MKKYLKFTIPLSISLACFNCRHTDNNRIFSELYVAPRIYTRTMTYDNGVFNYDLDKKNIMTTRGKSYFLDWIEKDDLGKINCNDSVIVMFYAEKKISPSFIKKVLSNNNILESPQVQLLTPRALMLLHIEHKVDTIFIYGNRKLSYNNKIYKMDISFYDFLIELLPKYLKANWGKTSEDTLKKEKTMVSLICDP